MSEPREHITNVNTWIGVVAGIFALLSAAFSAGLMFGPMRSIPDQLARMSEEITGMKLQGSSTVAAVATLNQTIGEIRGAQAANNDTDSRQWEQIRANSSRIENSVTREAFLEWKADLERQNRDISAPALKREPPQ